MRVVIQQTTALRQRTGVGHYTHELLRALAPLLGPRNLVHFPDGWLRRVWKSLPVGSGPGAQRAAGRWRQRMCQGLRHLNETALGLCFRETARWKHCTLYHEPNFIPLPCDLPTVVTVHDLSLLRHPDWHPADRVAHFEKRLPRLLNQARHIITGSAAVRAEIIDILGVAPERVCLVPYGIRQDLGPASAERQQAVRRHFILPDRYLLYVGTIEPRKNLLMLLRAYCRLPAAVRDRCPLVLAGGWGWNSAEVAEYFQGKARQRGVRQIGYVHDDQLAALYSGARALLFPSLYEGYGLPPLEMLACSGAVLAADIPPVRELVGGHACLLNPCDEDAWVRALTRIVSDDEWRNELARGGPELAREFTWEQCALETLAVYELTQVCPPARSARRPAPYTASACRDSTSPARAS